MLVAGVDEAGRGPLAGPVVAAAVILNPDWQISGLNDSKKLSASRREALFEAINERAIAVGIGQASCREIDEINILNGSMLAMSRAVAALETCPDEVLCDGNRCPDIALPVRAIIGGDATVASISAASIIAKVTRDRIMAELDRVYPAYGFARHKGYPTREHRATLQRLGPIAEHRLSFRPVRACVTKEQS